MKQSLICRSVSKRSREVLALCLLVLTVVLVDVPVARWAHEHGSSPELRKALQVVRMPGHFAFTAVVALIVAWRSRQRLLDAAFLVAATVAASSVAASLKWMTGRIRPFKGNGASDWRPFPPDLFHTPNLCFPSGDATLAFATAAALALLFPRIKWPAFALATLVGAARVMQGAHYPGDVLAGLMVALLVVRMVWSVWPREKDPSEMAPGRDRWWDLLPAAGFSSPLPHAERGAHGVLADEMRTQGKWLFRWRSFLPLLLVPWAVHGLSSFEYPLDSHSADILLEVILLGVAFVGVAVRVATVGFVPRGTSGRNTKQMKAYALNKSGVYSVVRHPLYLANFLVFIAPLIYVGDWVLVAFATLAYWLYYERIMIAEEAFLFARYGDEYLAWAQKTPAIIPKPRLWHAPSLSFSWRSALRREYTTLFLVIGVFTSIEVAGDYVVHRTLVLDPGWCVLLAIGCIVYLTVRILKKSTRLLEEVGR